MGHELTIPIRATMVRKYTHWIHNVFTYINYLRQYRKYFVVNTLDTALSSY